MTTVLLCGVDEAGRGPLAGSVFAAAVVLPEGHGIVGLNDSKKLTERRREALFPQIQQRALAWAIAEANCAEIDELNILHATMLAMERAVAALALVPHKVLIDGNRIPKGLTIPAEAIVEGDAKVESISAASILAKVARDRALHALDIRYPGYGFARHKGYPTAEHLAALARLGPCPEHRRSFGPVRAAGAQASLW
ncbi:ribonuclease HII [Chitiniphilus shinanonensis]|uniref:Ribonuclease HII n=1 Tax=Chitiniphilus shinanonensis TaxID=553088 RepID=A0ABQ6BQ68_9NEIS|nr:ribonuclease HII [Chitiniphilus shinanonensis]GLS04118.1 ribonuclease HII [Chitiniphilus shinanonensis]